MEEHGISDPGKRFPHFDPLKRSGDLKGIKGEERRGKNEEILGREEENIELRKEKIEGRGKILPWNKQEDDYSFKVLLNKKLIWLIDQRLAFHAKVYTKSIHKDNMLYQRPASFMSSISPSQKFKFYYSYIFATWWCEALIS